MLATGIDEFLDGVDTQAIQMELFDPVDRVLHEEVSDRTRPRAVEIEGTPPLAVAIGKEVLAVGTVVVAVTRVVVDDIPDEADAKLVLLVDEGAHVVRRPVGCERRKRQGRVVTPPESPTKGADGHDLQHRDAQVAQPGQPRGGRQPGTFSGKGADMHFVENFVAALHPVPGVVGPAECV